LEELPDNKAALFFIAQIYLKISKPQMPKAGEGKPVFKQVPDRS
jgi:hypothetical protein